MLQKSEESVYAYWLACESDLRQGYARVPTPVPRWRSWLRANSFAVGSSAEVIRVNDSKLNSLCVLWLRQPVNTASVL